MFPLSRSKKNKRVGNDFDPENVEGEENGSTVEEIGAEAVVENPNNADDGIFVTETDRKRGTSVAKILTSAAIGLAIAGTALGTGYGVTVAVQRSRVSPSTIGVEEQPPQVETSLPTYAPTAVEEAVVTPNHPPSLLLGPHPSPRWPTVSLPGPHPSPRWPTEAIAVEATEPADLEGEDMPMPQIEEEELATLDELFLCMSMHKIGGAELSTDYGANGQSGDNGNGAKSGKTKKSKKGNTMPPAPTKPTRKPAGMKPSGESSKKGIDQDHRMNVLLLYADDWRYDTLGVAGNPVVKTPVLDALSQEGVRFTENCVTTSICWVSRATLYSGQYLARHKFKMIGRNFDVPQNEMVYSLLKKHNYTVGHVGKLGLNVELNRSLNFNFYNEYEGWHWKRIGYRLWHVTEKNTADALLFLKNKPKNKPFFLNVAYYATHAVDTDERQYFPQRASMSMYLNDTIFEPEDTYDKMPYFFTQQNEGRNRWRWRFDSHEKHQRMMKNYYRMASEVDTSVGTIVDQLRKSGELNNTMIIFTTDNGYFHAEHGLADKWYPHQESIRVPLIIKDPRMDDEYKGTVNDAFTLNVDLTATILSAAGVNVPPTMMGRDMSVLYMNGGLKGEPAMQSRQLANTKDGRHYPQPAKDGGGKYHSGSENTWRTEFFYELATDFDEDFIPASEALVRKDFKYFYWPQYNFEQLYDIRTDPKEMNDLVNSTELFHQRKLDEMRTRFRELKDLAHSDLAIIL